MNTRTIFETYRRLAVTIAAVGALVIAVLIVVPTANAATATTVNATTATQPGYHTLNASGRTAAPNGWQWIIVNGTGVHVNYIQSVHDTITLTKCDVYSRFIYQQGNVVKYENRYNAGCYSPSYAVTWTANMDFDSQSPACTQSKDSLTNGLWTNAPCETIG